MANRIPVVVAGVSELQANDPTLLVATEVARAPRAELHLVHAYQLPPLLTMSPGLEAAFPEGYERYAGMLQASLEAAARALPGGERARCRVVPGAAGPVLADVADQVKADLLIVGAAHGTRLGRALLGTTAQRALRQSRVPVLVARRPVTPPLGRVLLTTDLSELSGAVHDRALATIATFFGTPTAIRSLMVLGWMGVPAPLTLDALTRAAEGELAAFLRAHRPGPRVEPVVRSGFTAGEIVDEALDWGADLLVVGTHARGWGARMMLGSVAEAALRDAPCNVLAIPPVRVATVAAPAEEEPAGALQAAAMAGIAL
jgi:nucleotide-binding universal stress UspA family protein